tara:strand:+ start:185 stop:334 length:150 start_codon:yes stop_codon:yes gene_type:complete
MFGLLLILKPNIMSKSNTPKNGPSKTGNPSGKGRENNPPRTKLSTSKKK